jgi:hypothetical protein
MAFDDADEPEPDHETVLQAVIRSLLTSDDLDQLCRDGDPIHVRSAETYADAGVLTLDRGVYLELSDGSRFGLTLSVSARGSHDTTALPPAADEQQHRVPRPTPGPGRRPDPDSATDPGPRPRRPSGAPVGLSDHATTPSG